MLATHYFIIGIFILLILIGFFIYLISKKSISAIIILILIIIDIWFIIAFTWSFMVIQDPMIENIEFTQEQIDQLNTFYESYYPSEYNVCLLIKNNKVIEMQEAEIYSTSPLEVVSKCDSRFNADIHSHTKVKEVESINSNIIYYFLGNIVEMMYSNLYLGQDKDLAQVNYKIYDYRCVQSDLGKDNIRCYNLIDYKK